MTVDSSSSILGIAGSEFGGYIGGKINDEYQEFGRGAGATFGEGVNNFLEYIPVVGSGIKTLNQDFLDVLNSRNQSLKEGFYKLENIVHTIPTRGLQSLINISSSENSASTSSAPNGQEQLNSIKCQLEDTITSLHNQLQERQPLPDQGPVGSAENAALTASASPEASINSQPEATSDSDNNIPQDEDIERIAKINQYLDRYQVKKTSPTEEGMPPADISAATAAELEIQSNIEAMEAKNKELEGEIMLLLEILMAFVKKDISILQEKHVEKLEALIQAKQAPSNDRLA